MRPLQTNREASNTGWDKVLFSQFKEHPTKPEVKRVERILSLLAAAETHLSAWRNFDPLSGAPDVSEFLDGYKVLTGFKRAYFASLEQLEAALKRYHWRSAISGNIDGFKEELVCETNAKNKSANWENAVVRFLLEMTKQPGALSRFRRCDECQDWFHAATNHQRFCGDECRKRHASRNPTFKEKRRVYMRDRYRPQQKERNDRSLAMARSTRQKKGKG
jgi:hypothetical protein